MSNLGRPRKTRGVVYIRTKSVFWWVRYRDQDGRIIKESTGTTNQEETERFLRKRLEKRDEGTLLTVLSSKKITFTEWLDWFLEIRSKPPFRAEKTHLQNLRVANLLRPVFGPMRLSDLAPEAIENYLRQRLNSGRRVPTKFGVLYRGKIRPMTVHQEFRVLRRILNVAVKQKRLGSNPCSGVEFPMAVNNTGRKPHYMTTTEQERIQFCAPNHLNHAIVIITETGLRPYKELMPMKKNAG